MELGDEDRLGSNAHLCLRGTVSIYVWDLHCPPRVGLEPSFRVTERPGKSIKSSRHPQCNLGLPLSTAEESREGRGGNIKRPCF